MAKGRSTTWQERVDIVLYCLAHDHEYQKAVNQYQVVPASIAVGKEVRSWWRGSIIIRTSTKGTSRPTSTFTITNDYKQN